jgi:hypothetical protein
MNPGALDAAIQALMSQSGSADESDQTASDVLNDLAVNQLMLTT